jgi:hypothetical protein
MNAFVGFWDITDFSLSRAFSQEIFGFLEFLTRGISLFYFNPKVLVSLPPRGPCSLYLPQ